MSAKRYKKYIETTEFPGYTHLLVSVSYKLGGRKYSNGDIEARGFYLSVTPVKINKGLVSTTLTSGTKMLILPAKRFSENQYNLAIEKSKKLEQELIDSIKPQQQKSE